MIGRYCQTYTHYQQLTIYHIRCHFLHMKLFFIFCYRTIYVNLKIKFYILRLWLWSYSLYQNNFPVRFLAIRYTVAYYN